MVYPFVLMQSSIKIFIWTVWIFIGIILLFIKGVILFSRFLSAEANPTDLIVNSVRDS